MSRFEEVGSTYVNIDKIETFWRDDNDVLTIELDDGQTLRTRDVMHALEDSLIGHVHTSQGKKNKEQLTRIAEALESINSNLSDVAEKLEDIERHLNNCIAYSGDNAFFRTAGTASTD